jgi:predicted Zn-dependent peptidase
MNIDPYRDEIPPRRELLPSGALLLSLPIPSSHSVALGIWQRRGAQEEPDHLLGSVHFLEHIVFKGSQRRSAYDIAEAFDSLGVAVDAFTTKDHVAFTIKTLPEYFEPACEILMEMILRPAFDAQMVALEKDVVCEEIQEARDTPEDRLHDAFAARIYGRHPRGRPILGTMESVRGLEIEDLRREHQRLFAGPNLVIAMAGHLEPSARDIVLRNLQTLPAGGGATGAGAETQDAPRDGTAAPASGCAAAAASRLEIKSGITQTYFEIGNLGISYQHPDRIPLYVLANILGGGMSSRLFQAVREREGLAYTIYTYSDMGRDTGLVSCAGSCSPEKTARLEEVVRREYAALIRNGISEEELASNRAQIKSQLIFTLEGVSNQMYRIAKNEILFGRFLPVTEIIEQIDAIDRDAVLRCAAEYFNPDRLCVATHGPA